MRYSILLTFLLLSATLCGAESETTTLPDNVANSMKKCHEFIQETFAITEGEGISRTEAAYFKHRVTYLFNAPALVSLLKDDSPQVYLPRNPLALIGEKWERKLEKGELSDSEKKALGQFNLKKMAQKLEKRELSEFEKIALDQLKKGKTLVASYLPAESPTSEIEKKLGGRVVEALGSIRAQKSCLECHKVEVGTLLGAFSYRIPESRIKEPNTAKLKKSE
jgi:hypothetical protein